MTDQTPLEEAFEGEIWAPTEFFANHFKLWVGAITLAFISFYVLYKWVQVGSEDNLVPILCAALLGFAWLFMGQARDKTPILSYDENGLTDRRHGFIPWDKIECYQYKKTIFSQSFGYSLVKGETPPKGALVYRVLGVINFLSGRPARIWQKHMVIGGLEPMLYGARAKRPDLDKT